MVSVALGSMLRRLASGVCVNSFSASTKERLFDPEVPGPNGKGSLSISMLSTCHFERTFKTKLLQNQTIVYHNLTSPTKSCENWRNEKTIRDGERKDQAFQ
jgi:hypothetical protein